MSWIELRLPLLLLLDWTGVRFNNSPGLLSDQALDTNIRRHKLAWIEHLFSLLSPSRHAGERDKKNTLIDGALAPRDSVCFSFQSEECSKDILVSHRKIQYVSSHM